MAVFFLGLEAFKEGDIYIYVCMYVYMYSPGGLLKLKEECNDSWMNMP